MPCLCEDCQLDQQRRCSMGVPIVLPFQEYRMLLGGDRGLRRNATMSRALNHLCTAQQLMHELLERGPVDEYQQTALDCEFHDCRQAILGVVAGELYMQPA